MQNFYTLPQTLKVSRDQDIHITDESKISLGWLHKNMLNLHFAVYIDSFSVQSIG